MISYSEVTKNLGWLQTFWKFRLTMAIVYVQVLIVNNNLQKNVHNCTGDNGMGRRVDVNVKGILPINTF